MSVTGVRSQWFAHTKTEDRKYWEKNFPKRCQKLHVSLEYRNKNQQLNNIAMNDIVDAWLKQC